MENHLEIDGSSKLAIRKQHFVQRGEEIDSFLEQQQGWDAVQIQIQEYCAFLKRLINLQQKLVRQFEIKVKVLPLPLDFPYEIRNKLKDAILPERSVSEVLSDWPIDIRIVPIFVWVTPRKGTVQTEGRDWLFNVHGLAQISFNFLPSGLDIEIVKYLETEKSDPSINLPAIETGMSVEVEYLLGGRSDGVNAWSILQFSQSVNSKMRKLSLSDHKQLLEKLAQEELIRAWPSLSAKSKQFFVLVKDV